MGFPRVAAVRVAPVQLCVTDSQKGVAMRILRVPWLTLTARFGHAHCPSVICPSVVVTLVTWEA